MFIHSQFHFYVTDRSSTDNNAVSFDCLYYTVLEDINNYYTEEITAEFQAPYQVIPYCMRPIDTDIKNEFPSVDKNILTFEAMKSNGVIVSQLLSWSATVDTMESYQEYLNNPTNKMYHKVFHNCTWPWFGLNCEYTFDLEIHSFDSIVRTAFIEKTNPPMIQVSPTLVTYLTCYTHLECNRGGSPICLDWREICDGQVDCFNDGIDEKDCFPLETSRCDEDEFQCHNGMCVPSNFLHDSPFNYDCMDGSDEYNYVSIVLQADDNEICYKDPTFRCEELARPRALPHFFCGDGQSCPPISKWCCSNGRSEHLYDSLYSYAANHHLLFEWKQFQNLIVKINVE